MGRPSPEYADLVRMYEGEKHRKGVAGAIKASSASLQGQLRDPAHRKQALQNILKVQLRLNEKNAMFTHAMQWFGQFIIDEYGKPGEYAAIERERQEQAAYAKGLVAAETMALERGEVKKRKIGKRQRRWYLNIGRSIDALIRAERTEYVDTLITRKRVPAVRYSKKGGLTVNGKRRTPAQVRAQLFRRKKAE